MLSTSKYRIPPLIPLAVLVLTLFVPRTESFGGVPWPYRLAGAVVFFVTAGSMGWFSTAVKPSRGEAFLSALVCAVLFYAFSSSNLVAAVDQAHRRPAEAVVEYRGVGEYGAGDATQYYLLAAAPGVRLTKPAQVAITAGYYEELRAASLGAADELTLTVAKGVLGLYSVPRAQLTAR